jgi:glutamyl-Q tRNA(Asp) synthetase
MGLYRGRFAPSPTGPLHFGSLIAALGSYLDARAHGGQWLLRIEDLDVPRCSPLAAEQILRTLEAFHLYWDGEVVWQSRRTAAYAEALERLKAGSQVFACACTRRELADSALNEPSGLAADGAVRYPGTCRHGLPPGKTARAWRVGVDDARISFEDAVQGSVSSELATDSGDFVLRRADGLFAYQLAVVVDDAEAGITHVVRGADLLASTPRQIYLQQLLGLSQPAYAHLPVAFNPAGEKLSKQTCAPSLDVRQPTLALWAALTFLGQQPPPELAHSSPRDCLDWALNHWHLDHVPMHAPIHATTLEKQHVD